MADESSGGIDLTSRLENLRSIMRNNASSVRASLVDVHVPAIRVSENPKSPMHSVLQAATVEDVAKLFNVTLNMVADIDSFVNDLQANRYELWSLISNTQSQVIIDILCQRQTELKFESNARLASQRVYAAGGIVKEAMNVDSIGIAKAGEHARPITDLKTNDHGVTMLGESGVINPNSNYGDVRVKDTSSYPMFSLDVYDTEFPSLV